VLVREINIPLSGRVLAAMARGESANTSSKVSRPSILSIRFLQQFVCHDWDAQRKRPLRIVNVESICGDKKKLSVSKNCDIARVATRIT
jgi:hypothetical protein